MESNTAKAMIVAAPAISHSSHGDLVPDDQIIYQKVSPRCFWDLPKQIVIERQVIAQYYSMRATSSTSTKHLRLKPLPTTFSWSQNKKIQKVDALLSARATHRLPDHLKWTNGTLHALLLKYEFHNFAGTKQFNASKIKNRRKHWKHVQFRGFQNFVRKTEAVAFLSALNRSRHHKGPQPSMKIEESRNGLK